MFKTRPSVKQDTQCIMEIWCKAVDTTHHFLAIKDRLSIEKELALFLPTVELTLACESEGKPVGFMYLHDGHMEALFIDPDYHGQGIGKALVKTALSQYSRLTTDVNEQNTQAVGFYERIGFERTGRSEIDSQGRPYPLIHLRFRQN
ncbi:acetyltransferase [Pectobacterium carotovorum]|uniref:acetyltransferase n=1 Tax=Pectobacterium carotovorum TaxID=554 RepID=UPI0009079F5B|nr:acetyltransferase [Pectobacterium carotovorum]GKV80630.1 acetyltransferase [Pectobacterium carotovorum subsp. carotovorum]GKW01409.1 acetyltransferase [Pectobacterium carotovorum subsp. carotovorum]GKW26711.1 acetyltransferase [Pectobacterium carotovorum subsp. carotovorum]GKW34504.1 acetyltransferase [Pectobacterium carotovorum subsp. carotovorum]